MYAYKAEMREFLGNVGNIARGIGKAMILPTLTFGLLGALVISSYYSGLARNKEKKLEKIRDITYGSLESIGDVNDDGIDDFAFTDAKGEKYTFISSKDGKYISPQKMLNEEKARLEAKVSDMLAR